MNGRYIRHSDLCIRYRSPLPNSNWYIYRNITVITLQPDSLIYVFISVNYMPSLSSAIDILQNCVHVHSKILRSENFCFDRKLYQILLLFFIYKVPLFQEFYQISVLICSKWETAEYYN